MFIVDSYSETNKDNNYSLANFVNDCGMSFNVGGGGILNECKFYLGKYGNPTGNATAKIYAHSGVYGTSSVPTGSALATSGNFDVSTLTTDFQLITFTFTGAEKINLVKDTKYVLVISYSGGDENNYVKVGLDATSPTALGNSSEKIVSSGEWVYDPYDVCFYVYGELTGPFPTFFKS